MGLRLEMLSDSLFLLRYVNYWWTLCQRNKLESVDGLTFLLEARSWQSAPFFREAGR